MGWIDHGFFEKETPTVVSMILNIGHWEIQELFKQDDIVQLMTGKPTRKVHTQELVLDQDELTTGFQLCLRHTLHLLQRGCC